MSPNRGLLWCGVAAGPLFLAVSTLTGLMRPGYSLLRHPVDSPVLAGPGWIQALSFLPAGVLLAVFAFGARNELDRTGRAGPAPWLLLLCGVGLAGAGLFCADPTGGRPPGVPYEPVRTALGTLHDAAFTLFFFGLPLACVLYALRALADRHWATAGYSVLTAVGVFGCFLWAGAGFRQHPDLVAVGGLYQRASLLIGFAWIAVLALFLLRSARTRGAPTLR